MRSVTFLLAMLLGLIGSAFRPGTTAYAAGKDDDDEGEGEGSGDGGDGGTGDDDQQDDEEDGLPEAVKAVLRKNRRELRAAQKAARDAQRLADELKREKEARDTADKTELDREREKRQQAEQTAAAAQQRVRQAGLRLAIQREAARLNTVGDVAVLERLIDADDIDWDEDRDEPTNVGDLLKELLEQHPYLARTDDGGDGTKPARRIPASKEKDDRGLTAAEREAAQRREAARIRRGF